MNYEISRRLVDGEWTTVVEQTETGGGALPDSWSETAAGGIEVQQQAGASSDPLVQAKNTDGDVVAKITVAGAVTGSQLDITWPDGSSLFVAGPDGGSLLRVLTQAFVVLFQLGTHGGLTVSTDDAATLPFEVKGHLGHSLLQVTAEGADSEDEKVNVRGRLDLGTSGADRGVATLQVGALRSDGDSVVAVLDLDGFDIFQVRSDGTIHVREGITITDDLPAP